MIDIKIKYQAVAFMPSVEANQSKISQMMELFADRELVPTTQPELSLSGNNLQQQIRFSLKSINNEWDIHFGIGRIDITKNPTDANGSNLGSIEQFCAEVLDIYTKISSKHIQKVNRIALSSSVILKEMKDEVMNAVYLNLFNPVKLYADNKPKEWNSRIVARIEKNIKDTPDTFNFVSEINRINGQININNELIPIDRIMINIDINSIPESTQGRFGNDELSDFYRNVSVWHNDLLNEILNKIK